VLHRVRPQPQDLIADLDQLIYYQEEPFGSTSIYAQHCVFRAARAAGIPVMLDGQGADEILAGYRSYLAARLASLVKRGHFVEAGRFLKQSARQPGSGGWRRLMLQSGGLLCPPACKALGYKLLGGDLLPDWLDAGWFRDRDVHPTPGARLRGRDMLRAQLQHTLAETSLPMLLRYEDRNSMAHSVESRVPFLTPEFVTFVLRLPEEYLIAPDGTSKSVFRAAMRGLVPDVVLDRKDKIGFQTPEKVWLSTLGDWVDTTLSGPAARRVPALRPEGMLREWQRVRAGRRPFDFRVWRWVNVVRWAERFDVSFAA
jgi:asparagine synthase (glutamine-hydrolysing)